jgi:hypothetical protein
MANQFDVLDQIAQLPGQYFTRDLNNLNVRDWQTTTPNNHGYGVPFVVGFFINNIPYSNGAVDFQTDNSTTPTGRRALFNISAQNEKLNKFYAELQLQINTMRMVPPLALIINPSNFSKRMDRPADYARGRRMNIVSMWHEGMTQISADGTSAGQYIYRNNGGGINGIGRVLSVSYKNLLSLVQIYKSNGIVYNNSDFQDSSSVGVPIAVGSVYIKYDGYTYIGSFDSFSVTDDASKPNLLSYSFDFTARYVVKDA